LEAGNLIFRRTWWLVLNLVFLHFDVIAMVCYFRPAGKNLQDQGPLFCTRQKPARVDALKKHRGKLLVLSITVVAAVGAAVYFGRLPLAGATHRINPYTCMKLRVGMPQDKVEAIFGAPPGDYSSGPAGVFPRMPTIRPFSSMSRVISVCILR
jgi:hypothetical protein